MGMKVKSAADIAKKWARVTPERAADYEEGVRNPKKDWKTETKKAEKNYEAGVATAVREKRFGKGVDKAGTEKWQEGAVTKGVARFGPGVAGAQKKYEEGFAPYREVLERTDLPPRYPKGDARNYERVKAVGQALHKKKVEG